MQFRMEDDADVLFAWAVLVAVFSVIFVILAHLK